MSRVVHTLTLFTSFSTLICCALPALLVTLGLGAVMASAVSTFPGLIWISQHKDYVFGFAAVMLTLSGILRYRSRNYACPVDKDLAAACGRARKVSGIIYIISLLIFFTGVFFAYIAPKIL